MGFGDRESDCGCACAECAGFLPTVVGAEIDLLAGDFQGMGCGRWRSSAACRLRLAKGVLYCLRGSEARIWRFLVNVGMRDIRIRDGGGGDEVVGDGWVAGWVVGANPGETSIRARWILRRNSFHRSTGIPFMRLLCHERPSAYGAAAVLLHLRSAHRTRLLL